MQILGNLVSLLYLTKVITFVSFHDTGMWQLIIMTIQTWWDVSRVSWEGVWDICLQSHQLYSPILVSVIWLHFAHSQYFTISGACLSVVLNRVWTLASPTFYIIIFVTLSWGNLSLRPEKWFLRPSPTPFGFV
jgi:hypothetical protein